MNGIRTTVFVRAAGVVATVVTLATVVGATGKWG